MKAKKELSTASKKYANIVSVAKNVRKITVDGWQIIHFLNNASDNESSMEDDGHEDEDGNNSDEDYVED